MSAIPVKASHINNPFLAVLFIFVFGILILGCKQEPYQLKESAMASVEAARTVGAEKYLADEFRLLQNSLTFALRSLAIENDKPAHQRNYIFVAEQLKWVSANASVVIANTEKRKAEVRIDAGERLTLLTKKTEQNKRFLANLRQRQIDQEAADVLQTQITLIDSAVVKINRLISSGHYLDALERATAAYNQAEELPVR